MRRKSFYDPDLSLEYGPGYIHAPDFDLQEVVIGADTVENLSWGGLYKGDKELLLWQV
jgi:hypothetical protein